MLIIFLAEPLKEKSVSIATREYKLSNDPGSSDDDHDNEIISHQPSQNRVKEAFDVGDIWFDKTIQEVARQQNRIALDNNFNAKKSELVDAYLRDYDGKNYRYAEVTSIVGTTEQIQKYAEKLLRAIFNRDKVELSVAVTNFIDNNYEIIKDVIDEVIDTYISAGFKFDPDTQVTIDAIGSLDNRQRYVNKRVNELLVKGQNSDRCFVIKDVQDCIEYLTKNPDFSYPDFDNSKPSTMSELLECFKVYSQKGV